MHYTAFTTRLWKIPLLENGFTEKTCKKKLLLKLTVSNHPVHSYEQLSYLSFSLNSLNIFCKHDVYFSSPCLLKGLDPLS